MKDLYNIPGDDHKDFRLKKFVEYQHEVPSLHYRFLGEWIKRNNVNFNDAILLSWYMSITYNEITCIVLYKLLKNKNVDYSKFWFEYKDKLNFGSAKKYNKNNNLFPDLMKDFEKESGGKYWEWFQKFICEEEIDCYKSIWGGVKKIQNTGRFSADLFLEMVVYLKSYFGINVKEPFELNWENCANLTSGIYNIFYEDEKANEYDKTGIVKESEKEYLSGKLKIIQNEISKTYPEQNDEISMFIGKICSFRNLFKNARYAGFHHDRQLGVIKEYEKIFPEYLELWKECYEIRKDIFPNRFLGELNGWEGIRPERKKYWLKYGLTGAEKNIDSIPKIELMKFELF